jgi:hypothetical protein
MGKAIEDMPMLLHEFKEKFCSIKARGFIKSQRKGDGAVGNTFEDELGLQENNILGPDIEGNELKAARKGAGGKQTLFTKEGEWVVSQKDYIAQYGFPHTTKIGEMSGQSTVTKTVNNRGLSIVTTDEYCAVVHGDTIIVKWDWETLVNQFAKKFPACVKVFADVEKRDGVEYFHYNEAYRFIRTDKNLFRTAIENDMIAIDIRMRTQNNIGKSLRNRGTAFRINHGRMEELFIKEAL